MFSITLICMGKCKEKFYIAAAEEYAKRMKGYCEFKLLELPEYRLPHVAVSTLRRKTSRSKLFS